MSARFESRFHRVFAMLAAVCLELLSAGSAIGADPLPSGSPAYAAYRWASPNAQPQVDAFGKWAGHPEVWGEDFDATETWDNIDNPGWLLGPWREWVAARDGRRLILSVPMLVGAWDRSGPDHGIDAKKPVSLEAGARGDYNAHYRELARNLVAQKLGNSVIRLGWEMNGGWYIWRGSDNPKAWADYFVQIVKTMRAVPGAEHLVMCWNPATGYVQFPAEQAWPGDDYVDVIGLDVYDQSWAADTYPIPKDATADQLLERQKKAWNDWNYWGNHGLDMWTKFAKDHKKPLAICEWGVCDRSDGHGGMDDPYFIEQMHHFINDPANHVLFQCYFDVWAPDGNHQLSPGLKGDEKTRFPRAAAKYLELFGGPAGK